MFVFEIVTPGTWLDYEDKDWSWKIQNQLRSLESQFFEANAALNLFVNAQSIPPSFTHPDNWDRDSQRRSEIKRAVEQERGAFISHEQWNDIHFEAEVRFKREKWSSGGLPREFEHNLPFIYARAFLYALDAFDKFLGVLAKEENVPEGVAKFHAQIAEEFPHLRGVRNTAQHLEDRARSLGAGKNPQRLKVKLTFAKGASLKDPARLFNSSLDGNVRRAIDIHAGEEVEAGAFKALVRQAIALNSGKAKSSKKKVKVE